MSKTVVNAVSSLQLPGADACTLRAAHMGCTHQLPYCSSSFMLPHYLGCWNAARMLHACLLLSARSLLLLVSCCCRWGSKHCPSIDGDALLAVQVLTDGLLGAQAHALT